ncbi:hypothetical protein DOTSEDRAFT_57307 [Dothistroma septosporum NZE10]|uniref:Uncharacterized protein n=1 Tax=Dothistroma septosporum (strain NZE10 / CBS 128990) TaxID=675120 RepID=M2YJC3_DOTSN|nr:hypothetical protein DOTSEDRAFT_57307 [Dothistroma septosporum NZE10]
MCISRYLCQSEIAELNQAFEVSLEHDSVLVFWTGIPFQLAKDWARANKLKTLTIAMGSLYADNKRLRPKARKSTTSWSRYMKGASWLFAQKACQNRRVIVLTKAPPNVYSMREHSSYREIEEPILKGCVSDQHAIQIDYVHPTVSGAAGFAYQMWPVDRSCEWFDFLECITITNMLRNIVQRSRLRKSESLRHADDAGLDQQSKQTHLLVAACRNVKARITQPKMEAVRLEAEKQQQKAREKRAANQAKVEKEQQVALEKRAAKQAKVEKEQQAAREKRAAKQAKVEKEQQAALEKRAAKQAKVEKEQQVAREKREVMSFKRKMQM